MAVAPPDDTLTALPIRHFAGRHSRGGHSRAGFLAHRAHLLWRSGAYRPVYVVFAALFCLSWVAWGRAFFRKVS